MDCLSRWRSFDSQLALALGRKGVIVETDEYLKNQL